MFICHWCITRWPVLCYAAGKCCHLFYSSSFWYKTLTAFLAPGLPSFLWSWAAGQASSVLSFLVSGSAVNSHIFSYWWSWTGAIATAPDKMLREAVIFLWKIEATGRGGFNIQLHKRICQESLNIFPMSFQYKREPKTSLNSNWLARSDRSAYWETFIVSYDLDCVFAVSFWFLKHLANSVVCQHTAHIDAS